MGRVLDVVTLCVAIFAFVLALITLAVFADTLREINGGCALFVTQNTILFGTPDSTKPACGIGLAGVCLAMLTLVGVCILNLVKLITGTKKGWIFIMQLVLVIVALVSMIVTSIILVAGWGVTCATFSSGSCQTSFGPKVSASAVLAGINVMTLIAGLVLTIVQRVKQSSD